MSKRAGGTFQPAWLPSQRKRIHHRTGRHACSSAVMGLHQPITAGTRPIRREEQVVFDSEINLHRLFGTIYCRLRRYPVGGAHCAPRQRKIIRFVGEHSDSLRAACGGCSLDAHCGRCLHSQLFISTLEKGVGQIRLLFLHCEGKSAALSLEGLTVGALILRWISLVRANGNAVQRTVRSGRTMVCALLHRTVNGLVAAIVTHRE